LRVWVLKGSDRFATFAQGCAKIRFESCVVL